MPEHTPAPTASRAVYGFALFLSFKLIFIMYLIWAIVPECYFEMIGITFLPQRYWAVAVPIFLLTVLVIFAFIIYPSLGLVMTPNINDIRTIKDKIGSERKLNGSHLILSNQNINEDSYCVCKNKEKCFKDYYEAIEATSSNKKIPMLKDLCMWDVSDHLYLKQKQ